MMKNRIWAVILLIVMVGVGYFVYASEVKTSGWVSKYPFKLGLDLAGGTELTYKAKVDGLKSDDISGAMEALRDVIEMRVNLYGVSEPLVQVQNGGAGSNVEHKLTVELPGVTNIDDAIKLIGQTPLLQFRMVAPVGTSTEGQEITLANTIDTGLDGRYLDRASLQFDPNTRAAMVSLQFNSEGAKLFGEITKNGVGKQLAIFLDGLPISAPVINQAIPDGKAQISGRFTATEAKTLVRNLNYGALPVPIELIGTQTIDASLGDAAFHATTKAGIVGFILIAIFLILWYRLPGVLATISLAMYVALSLAVFKLIPVTFTAAGLAGFILSIGMAVDANILIFERMREELQRGLSVTDAIREGFARAWLSIRDSNLSSIITALVLYYFSSTAVIKGFALVFGLGVLISMFTAITASRTLLVALGYIRANRFTTFIFSSGLHGSVKKNG